VSRAWLLTLLTGGSTVAIKGLGALLPARPETSRVSAALARATPFLLVGVLTALIVVQVFSVGHRLTIDARLTGLFVAVSGVLLRVPPAVILIAAALATALVRFVIAS
jgi:hypothetical protein